MIKKNFHILSNILFIIGVALILLTGCGGEKLEGQKKVEKAREDFSKLHSGVVTVTNLTTGEVEQTLTFKYDEVGILLYSLTGTTDGKPYEQYCNGYELYTFENDSLDVVKKQETTYQTYTYDVRYPMTDDDYLYFEAGKITSVSSVELDDGSSSYVYNYEPSAITADENLGELKSFMMTFYFDKNDKLTHFDEFSTYQKNGAETSYEYRMEISDRDSVEKIQMPENIKILSEK